MAAQDSPTPERQSHARRNILLALVAVVVIAGLAGGGYGLWYLFFRPAGPPSVASAPPVLPSGGVVAPASLDGQWNIDTTIGSISDGSASFAGYRVKEQLVGIGANTAVGRTTKVTGTMTLSGAVIQSVNVTADLTALRSDQSNRDNQLRRQAINTDSFPTSTFKLTTPIDLGTLPAEGVDVKTTATGDFTLHGQTHSVTLDVQAVRQGGVIAVTGSMDVTFADYGFQGPTSFSVLSVEDHGIMEFHLLFTHA